MKNIKTSWLSREALALGLYSGALTLLSIFYYFDAPHWLKLITMIPIALIGVYGIYAQSMIYRVPARPAWDRKSTTLRFFGTGYLGFLLVALLLAIDSQTQALLALMAPTLMAGMYQLHLIYEEMMFYKHLDKENPLYYQLSRTKRLLEEHFAKQKKIRLITLSIFALALPMLSIVSAAAGMNGVTVALLTISFIGALISELIGRYLFYTTVVPLGLAGNFFAGNQRG